MGLALDEMRPSAIVDWMYDTIDERSGKLRAKEMIRRGIITRIDGSLEDQSIKGVWIKFDRKEKEVYCKNTAELVLAFDAKTKVAREAWRRLMGSSRDVGAVRVNRAVARRPVVQDAMGVTPLGKSPSTPGTVEKAMGSAGIDDLIGEDTYVDEGQEQGDEGSSVAES